VAFGCGSASGVASKTVTPCGTANAPTWSSDGTQIAWYGYRWPKPHGHGVGDYNILRGICVSNADGTNLHPLPNTVCSEHCSPESFSDPTGQIDWVASNLIVSANDFAVFRTSIGQGRPKLLGHNGPEPYSIDAAGDRVATANVAYGCSGCHGPVTIRSVASGAVVGTVGGTKHNNNQPSLSPDGTQVVFTRTSGKNPEATPSIWTASADGSHLRRLEPRALNPLWSPAGNQIAYFVASMRAPEPWRVVPSQGGASKTLLRNGPGAVFGWSPDGKWIAYGDSKGRLAIIDVATKKVRTLLKLKLPYSSSSATWSPDSQELLVVWRPPAHTKCPSGLWRVPVSGGKPHLVHGC
jgi:WD40 repeat protein